MAKIDVNKVELVWPGKYNEDGTLKEVPRVNLPFQVIERVNESRATREAKKSDQQLSLFDVWEGDQGDSFEEGWRNKLIWGDNLLVMSSLLDKFAGRIDLIYIDPPFATGADFSFSTAIGDMYIGKEQSVMEEKAYRDTWGRGIHSYLQMMYPRLSIMRDLLSENGSIYVHIGPDLVHNVRDLLDEVFGVDCFVNQISWQRTDAHSNVKNKYGAVHDFILFYRKGSEYTFIPDRDRDDLSNSAKKEYSLIADDDGKIGRYQRGINGRRFKLDDVTVPGVREGRQYEWRGATPSPNRSWPVNKETMEKWLKEGRLYLRNPQKGAARCKVSYLDENKGILPQDLWINLGRMKGGKEYATEKPERLLERIIKVSSNEGSLVADFFSGSGTTLAVSEKTGRRWIGCDLSKFGIHIARKRLLEIEDCQPFEILNLGKYERQYWQGIRFDKEAGSEEGSILEYFSFILRLYQARPMSGTQHLHGKKGRALVHVGAVDAPVTIGEVNDALEECLALEQKELHILGWEWEMGLNDLMAREAKRRGVKLLLLQIPREVMEQQAVDKGDIQFFELAYLEVEIKQPKKRTVKVALEDFVIPNTELIPEDVREKVKKWSDYIDYWAVDWNFQEDTFLQGWVAYRTRKERKLPITSDAHTYEEPGSYTVVVKVIDIFGNDTTQAFEVEVS